MLGTFHETLKRSASIEDSIIEIDGREYRLEVVHDFFLQKDEIMRLSKKLTSEQALLECVSALSEGTEISQAVNRFLEVVGRFYQAARSYIFEFDTDKKVADNTFEWCSEGVTSQIDNLKGLSLDLLSDWSINSKRQESFSYLRYMTKWIRKAKISAFWKRRISAV